MFARPAGCGSTPVAPWLAPVTAPVVRLERQLRVACSPRFRPRPDPCPRREVGPATLASRWSPRSAHYWHLAWCRTFRSQPLALRSPDRDSPAASRAVKALAGYRNPVLGRRGRAANPKHPSASRSNVARRSAVPGPPSTAILFIDNVRYRASGRRRGVADFESGFGGQPWAYDLAGGLLAFWFGSDGLSCPEVTRAPNPPRAIAAVRSP